MSEIYYGADGYKKKKSGRPIIDLSGKRFGLLVVEGLAYREVSIVRGKPSTVLWWKCKCDCGNVVHVRGSRLKGGVTVSCGCKKKMLNETLGARMRTFSYLHPRLAKIWRAMINRCTNPKNNAYSRYGGRGICVCDEWLTSLEAFCAWALENGYDETAKRGMYTIDRINCNGNYEPSNCRWVDMKVQNNNRRNNKANKEKYGLKYEVT